MKVISIQEPFASLILNGYKKIETRSWKTNYRGEIYIHACSNKMMIKKLNKTYIDKLIKNIDMHYGNIICKANLIDCVYMDESFIKKIKKNEQEYNLGIYEIGRYAWILDEITPINTIKAKGKLNIWNYN